VPPSNSGSEAIQRLSLKNREYAYIEDANRGVVLVEMGPKVLTLEAHLTLVMKSRMVELGTGSWCVVRNPVVRAEGRVALEDFGQARIAVGDREVRVGPQVFPLFPGEALEGEITPEYVLGVYEALRLRALTAFLEDTAAGGSRRREAGDEWLMRGPGRYVPNAAVVVVSDEKARMLKETEYCWMRIIDIDIKDIAPVDDKTALKLREAIDTNIQIQLDASRQEAQAAAELKRIRSEEETQLADISSHCKAEAERQSLIELQNRNNQLATLSRAKVEAEAQLERARVESEEALARAEAEARASRIRTEAELERERKMTELTMDRQKRLNDLEVERQARLTEVEAGQFRQRVEALGGGENFVKAVAAQARAAVVGGLDKVVFLPSGSHLNLFDSMQGLLGPGGGGGGANPTKREA